MAICSNRVLPGLALKIVAKARNKKIIFVSELGREPGLVQACGPFQVLRTRVREPVRPEDGHRLLQHVLSAKARRAPHRCILR
jgi:hypothetical protein